MLVERDKKIFISNISYEVTENALLGKIDNDIVEDERYSVLIQLLERLSNIEFQELTKDCFIVEADRKDFTFKYIVTAKRLGFEADRNAEFYEINKDINNTNIEYLNSNQEIEEINIDKDL